MEMCWTVYGMFCGLAANRNQSKKNGSMFPAAFCTSAFKLGAPTVCLKSYSKRWFSTTPGSAKSVSMMSPAPLGGSKTGKNPTDRGKLGSKVHLLVDERGAPLAIFITGSNEHDKWSADDLIVHIVAKRPNSEQHFCANKSYDYEDVHVFVGLKNYIAHIKHRRRKNEPKDECSIPGEKSFPDRRWVVEITFIWLAKRRSIATRWCKKSDNWLAFVHMACSQTLLNIISG
jgi:transposase